MSPHVLLADPSEAARQACRDSLLPLGCEVTCVASAEAALRARESSRPDVVILDEALRYAQGRDVAAALKAGGYLPVLLACSQTSSDSGDQAVDLTISKPVSGPTLRVAVRFILQVSSVIARARAEQAELCQQLRAHRDRVDFEVHDLRRRFASLRIGLSHLAGLIGYRDDEIWQVLSDCLEGAGQASERLDQFLVVAESEQLGLELNLTRIDLFELVFRALDQHRRWAASRSLRLRNLVPKSLRVDADPQLMERVLTNLVENAVRYADHDGELVVDAERLARGVELVVSNTGPAVPEQVRECLFQKFVRGPDRGEATGAGLGLYFCHCVVKEHGGSIRVEQRPGWAVSVVVRLPS